MTSLFSSRPVLLFIIVISMSGYNVLNNTLKQGRKFKHKLDDKVPFWPVFVYFYLVGYVAWFLLLIAYIFLFQPLVFVQQLTASIALASAIAYPFFLFFPTYVDSIYPTQKRVRHKLVRFLFKIDKPFNAFPSMHVYIATILTIYSSLLFPQLTVLFVLFGVTIAASTVLTKRHYLYDIPGGIVVGVVSSALALFLV